MLVLIIPFGAWFTICSQQISQNLMNKQIAKKKNKRHGKYMHGKYIYIYTQYVISPGTPAKKPIQKNKALPFFTHFHPPGPKKKPLKFWGYFFLDKTPWWLHSRHRQLLFLNDNLHAAGAPHGTTKLGAGFSSCLFE